MLSVYGVCLRMWKETYTHAGMHANLNSLFLSLAFFLSFTTRTHTPVRVSQRVTRSARGSNALRRKRRTNRSVLLSDVYVHTANA